MLSCRLAPSQSGAHNTGVTDATMLMHKLDHVVQHMCTYAAPHEA